MSSSRSSGSRHNGGRSGSNRRNQDEFQYSSGGVSFRVNPPEQVSVGVVISPTVTVIRQVEAGSPNVGYNMIATLFLVDRNFNPIDALLAGNTASGFWVDPSGGAGGGGGGGGSSSRPILTQAFEFPNLAVHTAGGPFHLQAAVGEIDYTAGQLVTEGHAYSSHFTAF